MIDVEPLIVSELALMHPVPDASRADWGDVLRRAGLTSRARRPRRRVAMALAVLIALFVSVAAIGPVRSAIAHGFDGFSAWITGQPGAPASPAAQRAFELQNERTWSHFAPGTELRQLIEARANGADYTLYGFRSGSELCLRLVARGAVYRASNTCATLQALQTAKEPALVVEAGDYVAGPKGERGVAASFGIVSDGVARVLVHAEDGTHAAIVAFNAFLEIDKRANLGGRIRGLDAIAANGDKVALPFQTRGHGTVDTSPRQRAAPPGPTKIERHVRGGTIAWVEHLEKRGQPMPQAELQRMSLFLRRLGKLLLAREIQPDPNSSLRVDVLVASPSGSLADPKAVLCGAGACELLHRPFPPGQPLTEVFFLASSSDQFTTISGLVSDDVASMKIYLAAGKTIRVPVKDNAYAVAIERASFPIRIVCYDPNGKVIYTHSSKDF